MVENALIAYFFILTEQGGNDHEIYESERTIGHTGMLF